ncbi:MAG: methyltransferase [Pseudomonadota bacterium]
MSEATIPHRSPDALRGWGARFRKWKADQIASPAFQRWAARFWLTRPLVRRSSARLYDLVSGFVYSQVLQACVELDLLNILRAGPQSADAIALRLGLDPRRAMQLCQAATAIGLLERRGETFELGELGAAALGVPGLSEMIRHHRVFYRDLEDPVALLRGDTDPELSRFWPYVLGDAEGDTPLETAADYSRLMATSQALVAEETLEAMDLSGIRHLADIGGGTGTFLSHVARRYPQMKLTLMDLPAVIDSARGRLADLGLESRIRCHPGSFLEAPLPKDVDAISLIRVCYDHDDATVRRLLGRIRDVLPARGRILISEPMSGGEKPERAGDAYFNFYTMAMTTGQPRSIAQHQALLEEAGFREVCEHRTDRPFLTRTISAVRED